MQTTIFQDTFAMIRIIALLPLKAQAQYKNYRILICIAPGIVELRAWFEEPLKHQLASKDE